MGQLRGLLRACAHEAPDPDSAAVLDRLVLGWRLQTLATVAYANAVPLPGDPGCWRLQVATAGHPPLVLCEPTVPSASSMRSAG